MKALSVIAVAGVGALALLALSPSQRVTAVHDGDTFTLANGTHVRLAGIDAPEIGTCRRHCAPGDPIASRNFLRAMALGREVRCHFTGTSYSRRVAWCEVDGVDLSCEMLQNGFAIRWAKYDPTDRLKGCEP